MPSICISRGTMANDKEFRGIIQSNRPQTRLPSLLVAPTAPALGLVAVSAHHSNNVCACVCVCNGIQSRVWCRWAKGATRSHRTLFAFTLDANASGAHCNSSTYTNCKKKKRKTPQRNVRWILRQFTDFGWIERNEGKTAEGEGGSRKKKNIILELTLMFGIQYRCVVSYATTNELFLTHSYSHERRTQSQQMRVLKYMRFFQSCRSRRSVGVNANELRFGSMCGFAKWLKLMYFFRFFSFSFFFRISTMPFAVPHYTSLWAVACCVVVGGGIHVLVNILRLLLMLLI